MSLHEIMMQRAAMQFQNDLQDTPADVMARTVTEELNQQRKNKIAREEHKKNLENTINQVDALNKRKGVIGSKGAGEYQIKESYKVDQSGNLIPSISIGKVEKAKPSAAMIEAGKLTGEIPASDEEAVLTIKRIREEEERVKESDVRIKAEQDASNESFKRANVLRDDYESETNDFNKVNDSYGRVLASTKDPSAAGDLALIFNYMKMLDPGSVVRESEFANAANSGGVPSRIRAQYNKLLEGERLDDTMRADFVDRAKRLYETQSSVQANRNSVYRARAERAGVNPLDVITERQYFDESGKIAKQFLSEQEAHEYLKNNPLPEGTTIVVNGNPKIIRKGKRK